MTTAAALLGFAALLLAIYCGLDPLRHRPFANFPDFDTHLVEFPPSSEIPTVSDPENLLQRAEIRFLNQIQGPESIVFDPKGRGPYTGVADGRVLFWDDAKWVDFVYTSPNRSEICDPKPSPRMSTSVAMHLGFGLIRKQGTCT